MKLPYVLLVDDDPTTNYLNRLLLTKQAVTDEVLVAQDGREALTVLAGQPAPPAARPALILLDVNMPGMNGLEFLEQFRQLPAAQQQGHVIVMLTTSLHPHDVQRVRELAVVAGTVLKPLTADKLRTVLAEQSTWAGRG